MAKCPTGFALNGEPSRTCDIEGGIGDIISSMTFNTNPSQWPFLALPFGKFEAPIIFLNHPTLLPNRGLYFNGFTNFLRLYEIRFNFQLTIHAWVYAFSNSGYLFSLETATPQNAGGLLEDNELAVKFGEFNGPKIYGIWNTVDSTHASAESLLNNWSIIHFQLDGIDMKLWSNDSLMITFNFAGAEFYHDTLLDLPHVFGNSIKEFSQDAMEMHLWQVILRNGLIPNPELIVDVNLDTLDTCKEEHLIAQILNGDCLDYCPTGSIIGSLPRICLDGPDVEISTAVFTTIAEFPLSFFDVDVSKGKYLGGLTDLGLGLIRGIDDPIFLPFRGLYFDGFNDFMRFVDFVFARESRLTVVLRKPMGVEGTLFSFDTI